MVKAGNGNGQGSGEDKAMDKVRSPPLATARVR